jgi:hypothetical protein
VDYLGLRNVSVHDVLEFLIFYQIESFNECCSKIDGFGEETIYFVGSPEILRLFKDAARDCSDCNFQLASHLPIVKFESDGMWTSDASAGQKYNYGKEK